MTMKKVSVVYFSPTGNSKKYGFAVAEAMQEPFESFDLNKREMRENRKCVDRTVCFAQREEYLKTNGK